ncbi:FUSC family protein [Subtercola sp. RTI3]|uniref:FUSC family protein n=1 Tax=Subtercola sp. RTI3 TaxID=3048639 RepID=UPI002680E667|nr:FUSC family protein [Subtercola sp. RTI3]MEA9984476.1 aromatic acid exporter family protein [Subtercola sp. RTI3]
MSKASGWFSGRRLNVAALSPERYAKLVLSTSRIPFLQVVKTSLAAIVSWYVCLLVLPAGQTPIFAVIAAMLVVQPSVNQSFGKALERSVGVVIGVVLAYFVGLVFGQAAWAVLLSVVLALVLGWALKLGPTSSIQIPISAMLVLSLGATTPGYAASRIVETLIGAVVGVAVNLLLVPPVALQPVHEAVARLGNEVAGILDSLAHLLSDETTINERTEVLLAARLLSPMRAKAAAALASGEESLKFNPRRSVHRDVLERDGQLLAMLSILVTRVVGMTRGVIDHYDDELPGEPIVGEIVAELTRAAHDLRLVILNADLPGTRPEVVDALPALTAPLMVAVPRSEHWILLGFLLEDLRRIHEELVEATAR